MSALLLMPLSWLEFIYDKIKREKQKWINLAQHGFTRKLL
jgi:hypothetical protein